MRKLFGIALVLCIGAFLLAGCHSKPAFDAGQTLSAKELEALRNSLENANGEQNGAMGSQSGTLDENKTIVYYIETSEVYHTNLECSYIRNSSSVIEGSADQAKELGKTRICGACAKNGEKGDLLSDGSGDTDKGTSDQQGENKTVVYYTESGEAYHLDRNCTYLRNSNLVKEGSVNDALNAGKSRPCSRCAD